MGANQTTNKKNPITVVDTERDINQLYGYSEFGSPEIGTQVVTLAQLMKASVHDPLNDKASMSIETTKRGDNADITVSFRGDAIMPMRVSLIIVNGHVQHVAETTITGRSGKLKGTVPFKINKEATVHIVPLPLC